MARQDRPGVGPARPPAVARVLERVTSSVREHGLFSPGERILVAVSGGPDSTCLLWSLHLLRDLFRIDIEAFHFDHRLRPGSGTDARYVRRLAGRLGIPFHLRTASSGPERGESVEAWAHTARWNAANEIRREEGFAAVAAGHTLDDQAETVLLGMIRGGGLHFVAGMPPRDDGYVVRPLLGVRRSEVEAFCRALRLRPRIDPSNRDMRLLRNAIRHEVLPMLERATGRDVRPTLARTASLLRTDADELFRQGAVAFGKLAEETGPGEYRIDADGLADLPEAIAGRVVQLAMWQSWVHPERETVRAVVGLARGRRGRRVDLPRGLIARRDRDYVVLSRSSPGTRRSRDDRGRAR